MFIIENIDSVTFSFIFAFLLISCFFTFILNLICFNEEKKINSIIYKGEIFDKEFKKDILFFNKITKISFYISFSIFLFTIYLFFYNKFYSFFSGIALASSVIIVNLILLKAIKNFIIFINEKYEDIKYF